MLLQTPLKLILKSCQWDSSQFVQDQTEFLTKLNKIIKHYFGCLDSPCTNSPQEFEWQTCLFWQDSALLPY